MSMKWIAALTALTALVGCGPDRAPELVEEGVEEKAIVGGTSASQGEYGHQVSIQTRSGYHFCGGSLIGDRWVLTAAHCLVGEYPSGIRIEAGMLDRSVGGESFFASQIIIHPGYNPNTSNNDVALIRLSRSTAGHDKVPLIDFQTEGTYGNPGTFATITGWGDLSSNGGSPDRLQEVDVPLLSNQTCQNAYRRENITDQMVCAGFLGQGGRDSCQGDSGGPLVVQTPSGDALMGVISWGYGCASASFPGVYARTSEFVNWIDSHGVDYTLVNEDTGPGPTDPPAPNGDDHGDDLSTATVLDIPSGDWVLDASLDAGDTDVFAFELEGEGSITLSSTSGIDTFGTLYDASGNELASSDDDGEGLNFEITRENASGTVYLAVRGYSDSISGPYTLNINADLEATEPPAPPAPPVTDDHGNEAANATQVALPLGSEANASATLDASDMDVFEISMMGAGTLTALTTGNTDTYGVLTDADGNVLSENDDTNGLQMRVSANVPAGTYYVWIRGYSSSTSGAYGVNISAN